jgi:RNA polymerase sigma factor (sigma-70 family)
VSEQNLEGERLLREMGRGSRAAFEAFYERYAAFVYRVALRMLHDPMEAEDLCHDIFLEAYRTAAQYDRQRGSVEAWLAVKTKSRCMDRLRRTQAKQQREQAADSHPLQGDSVEETVLAKLERETVRNVLNGIPEPQRQAVYGAYFQAKTHRELADIMARPIGTVKSLIRYGLHNLRKQLAETGWYGSGKGGDKRE